MFDDILDLPSSKLKIFNFLSYPPNAIRELKSSIDICLIVSLHNLSRNNKFVLFISNELVIEAIFKKPSPLV